MGIDHLPDVETVWHRFHSMIVAPDTSNRLGRYCLFVPVYSAVVVAGRIGIVERIAIWTQRRLVWLQEPPQRFSTKNTFL